MKPAPDLTHAISSPVAAVTSPTPGSPALLSPEHLAALLRALRDDGYRLIGPSVRDGAIVHTEIAGLEDLPAGWSEVQDAGRYRLERRPSCTAAGRRCISCATHFLRLRVEHRG